MKQLIEASFILSFIMLVIVMVTGVIIQHPVFIPIIFGVLGVNALSFIASLIAKQTHQ